MPLNVVHGRGLNVRRNNEPVSHRMPIDPVYAAVRGEAGLGSTTRPTTIRVSVVCSLVEERAQRTATEHDVVVQPQEIVRPTRHGTLPVRHRPSPIERSAAMNHFNTVGQSSHRICRPIVAAVVDQDNLDFGEPSVLVEEGRETRDRSIFSVMASEHATMWLIARRSPVRSHDLTQGWPRRSRPVNQAASSSIPQQKTPE